MFLFFPVKYGYEAEYIKIQMEATDLYQTNPAVPGLTDGEVKAGFFLDEIWNAPTDNVVSDDTNLNFGESLKLH